MGQSGLLYKAALKLNNKNELAQISSGKRDMRITLQNKKKCPSTKSIKKLARASELYTSTDEKIPISRDTAKPEKPVRDK